MADANVRVRLVLNDNFTGRMAAMAAVSDSFMRWHQADAHPLDRVDRGTRKRGELHLWQGDQA